MRETKYRIWDKTCKKMVAVRSIDFDYVDEEGYLEEGHVTAGHRCDLLPFDEVELMQYTGMKDKNGVEIYEGDIYHHGDPRITYTVVWVDSGLKGKQNSSTSYAGLESWRNQIEVIGNIYENPELLERETE